MTDEQFESVSRELVNERHRREALTRKLNAIRDHVTRSCGQEEPDTVMVRASSILLLIEAA